MNVLITGGTGFIGDRLVRHLIAAGHEVRALVRDPGRAAPLEALGVELVRGDIQEPASLPGPMEGVDGVFHLAAWYRIGARDRSAAGATNVQGTRNVLRTAGDVGVRRIVYTSTIAVFGDTKGRVVADTYRHEGPWLNEYERTKWLAHYEVALPMAEAGLPLVIVQPGLVYGPGDHSNVGSVLRDYLRRRLPVVPAQGGCWAHVDDIARGHLLAFQKGRLGENYVLGGQPAMWDEVLRIAHEITGVRPPRLSLPPALARLAAVLARPIAAVLPLPPTYHPETLRLAGGVTYWADDGKARRELGWEPRPLREGLAETLEAERAALG